MERTVFEKRRGTGGIPGQRFEAKLITLIYLECLTSWRKGRISSFLIGANVNGCGAFDDIVVRFDYEENQQLKSRRMFIQAKHKENNTKKPGNMQALLSTNEKNDFSLIKYHKSFVDIKENLGKLNPDFGSETDETDYIIYTNNNYKKQKNGDIVFEMKDYHSPVDIIFKIDQLYQIDRESKYCDVINQLPSSKEFVDNLKLLFNQPDEEQLEEILINRLSLNYEFHDVTRFYKSAFERMFRWWEDENFLLNENEDLFLEALLMEHTRDYVAKLQEYKVIFSQETIEYFTNFIEENKIVNVITDDEFLHCIMICQALARMNIKYFICNMKTQEDSLKQARVTLFDQINCLIILIDREVCNIEHLVNFKNNKHLIFISKPSSQFSLSEKCLIIENHFFNMVDFNEETRSSLKRKRVKIQGIEVELGSLIDDEGFNSDLIVKLIKNEVVEIGKQMTSFDKNKNLYINRNFSKRTNCKIELTNDSKCKFAITGWNKDLISKFDKKSLFDFYVEDFEETRLKNDPRIFLLSKSGAEIEYAKLIEKYPLVHWIHFDDEDKPLWVYSGDDLNKLIMNIDDGKNCEHGGSINDDSSQFVIVGADPGMGKSTFVDKLIDISENNTFSWVVRIDLNAHKKFLNNMKVISEESVFNFIADVLNLKQKYELDLFRHCYFKAGRILLLFDGFDEICSTHSDKVTKIFHVLKESKVMKILITTRLHECENLEYELVTHAYRLSPFSEAQIDEYFHLYLKSRKETFQNKPGFFTAWKRFKNKIKINQEFLNNPLHLRMMVDYFITNTSMDDSKIVIKIPNKLDLYDSIIESKFYDIYCKTKGNVTDEDMQEELYTQFLQVHKKIAIFEVFSEGAAILLGLNSISENAEKWLKSGFITGKKVMVHRTFVEYFAGFALCESFANKPQLVEELFKQVDFYSDQYKEVRMFFDLKLAVDPMHMAVLTNNHQALEELASKDVNVVDAAGRTPLHLAISHKNNYAFGILIDSGARVDIPDKIYGWTHWNYALNFGNYDVKYSISLVGKDERRLWSLDTLDFYPWTNVSIAIFDKCIRCKGYSDSDLKLFFKDVKERHRGNDDSWHIIINTISRMLTDDPSWLQLFNDIKSAVINFPLPHEIYNEDALESLFKDKKFCYKRLSEAAMLDNNLKIVISNWNEETIKMFPPQESILNLKDRQVDQDLNSFRIFLLDDTKPEFQFNKICDRLKGNVVWVKSNQLKLIASRRWFKDEPIDLTETQQSLEEILNNGEKVCLISSEIDFDLCKNNVDLEAFDIVENVNAESVKRYLLKSLFLKHGSDIDVFHKYFERGQTTLVFYHVNDDADNQILVDTMRQRKAFKFCVKTGSKIVLYHLSADLKVNEKCIAFKDFNNLFNQCVDEELEKYFYLNKLISPFKRWINSNRNRVKFISILMDCLKPNSCIKIEQYYCSDIINHFIIIDLLFKSIKNFANTEEVYEFVHQIFLRFCDEKCTYLMNDDNTILQLTSFPYIDKRKYRAAMKLLNVLEMTRMKKIFLVSNNSYHLASKLHTVYHSVQFHKFGGRWNSHLGKINEILTGVLQRCDSPADFDSRFKLLMLEKAIDGVYEILEKHQSSVYGSKLVLLLSPLLFSKFPTFSNNYKI